LGLEFCDCRHLNILHVLCPSLCLPVSRNIIGCELTRKRTKRSQ